MDLSSLIFVALFVAWAVYLVPKALRHHEEDATSRSVEGFSDRLRVLARREAVSSTQAQLVGRDRPVARDRAAETESRAEEKAPLDTTSAARTSEARTSEEPAEETSAQTDAELAAPTPAPRASRPVDRPAARRAAARRRRVFNVLLLAIVVVAGLAIGKVVAWAWLAAPTGLMVAWLVACRLMVKRERAARSTRSTQVRKRRTTLADEALADEDAAAEVEDGPFGELRDDTDEIPVVTAEVRDESAADVVEDGWTPVSVPLPTYVAKAPAGRTVRTIDLDSTGVWSSGRNEADSQLAREADAQRAQADAAEAEQRRATGS
ncbi:divisome protein SepX/GlpR [Nocardioides sp. BYT-33-1]|uniref:divisome protein SepX/GlpR n=1 Tax=Nocardioides sp. BYT-33-1 TaxID=3416952 RepID=UPI003F529689